jgi:homogentisate 1,2-dioxygenase
LKKISVDEDICKMHHYSQGRPTTQGHKGIPEGQFEEEQGLKGFFGPVSHLIKKSPSTKWIDIEGELKPRMYDLVKLPENQNQKRQRLFFNHHLSVFWEWHRPQTQLEMESYRNADGDLVYFCHKGQGQLWSEYGVIDYRRGHYLIVPKCLTHFFRAEEPSNFFVVENRTSHYEEPDRGLVGRHALYDTQALAKPNLDRMHELQRQTGVKVLSTVVKHGDQTTRFKYAEDIFDVVGWKGDLYPFALHVDDMMPLMSHRAHLPPSAHTTFVAREFVICTFLPRPLEEDADALKVPFYHQNIDYDEILFYHDGDFFSRDNLHAGMLSFHPAGFPHGPHPKAIQKAKQKTHTDEYAVMLDSRWPLQIDVSLKGIELPEYWKSWMK